MHVSVQGGFGELVMSLASLSGGCVGAALFILRGVAVFTLS